MASPANESGPALSAGSRKISPSFWTKAAVAAARDVGMEIHFCIRPEAFFAPFPFDGLFTSRFLVENQEVSLFLLKGTGSVSHQGGVRLKAGETSVTKMIVVP